MLKPVKCENGIEQIDTDFKSEIVKILVKRFVSKAILPSVVGKFIAVVKGIKYIWRAVDTLGKGHLNVDVLNGASVAACLVQKNYKTARTIIFMLSISSLLENYTRAKTKAALTDSLAVKTDKVWLADGDTDVLIPMSELKVGDCIRIRTGSVIPVDGEVTDGEASVNESSMTGEPLSVMKSEGATVFAGTVVDEGSMMPEQWCSMLSECGFAEMQFLPNDAETGQFDEHMIFAKKAGISRYLNADELSEIERHIAEHLPEYMIPREWIQLSELPLNANGKVSIKKLPRPFLSGVTERMIQKPETEVQQAICGIWSSILGVSKIGIDDNFFRIGGDSVLMLKMLGEICQHFGTTIAYETFLEQPTVVGLEKKLLHENSVSV